MKPIEPNKQQGFADQIWCWLHRAAALFRGGGGGGGRGLPINFLVPNEAPIRVNTADEIIFKGKTYGH